MKKFQIEAYYEKKLVMVDVKWFNSKEMADWFCNAIYGKNVMGYEFTFIIKEITQ